MALRFRSSPREGGPVGRNCVRCLGGVAPGLAEAMKELVAALVEGEKRKASVLQKVGLALPAAARTAATGHSKGD